MSSPNLSFLPPACAEAARDGRVVLGPGFGGGEWLVLDTPSATLIDGDAEALRRFAADIPDHGVVAGFIGYEWAREIEPGLNLPPSPDKLPVMWVGRFNNVLHVDQDATPSEPAPIIAPQDSTDWTTPGVYRAKVQTVIDHIRAGDIFQANISRRLSAHFDEVPDAAALFRRVVHRGAAPYAAFLSMEQGAVISNSPELFFRVDGRHITAEPIKGTRPRGDTPEEDEALAAELLRDPKDRAENIMIADLLRNDLSKVCADHTITEDAICALRTLPRVHHLFSRISGALRPGLGPIDALMAAFPCGSITGAPKYRAMQIIAEQEGEGRGPYCGTVFVIPENGPAVFSVAIRTAVVSTLEVGAQLDLRAGGGITILSDPEAEYRETEDKAYPFRAMFP